MTTKTTGAELKRFYSHWPDDGETYHEDETVLVNGEAIGEYADIPDDGLVTIDGGIVYGPQWNENEPSFEVYFKRWRKAQSIVTMVIEVERTKENALRSAIKAAGGKIIK